MSGAEATDCRGAVPPHWAQIHRPQPGARLISAPSSTTCSETRSSAVRDRYDLDLV